MSKLGNNWIPENFTACIIELRGPTASSAVLGNALSNLIIPKLDSTLSLINTRSNKFGEARQIIDGKYEARPLKPKDPNKDVFLT